MGDTRAKLPRLVHTGRIVGFVAAVAVLVAGASFLGFTLRGSDGVDLAQKREPIVVTAKVERRAVADNAVGSGLMVVGATTPVPAPPGETPRVVTDSPHHVGDTLTAPTFLGAVSGEPLILLHLEIPLYRDLRGGDRGEDVRSLREAFDVSDGDTVTWELLDTVSKLYSDAGWRMPWSEGKGLMIQRDHFVNVDAERVTVAAIAGRGDVVGGEELFAALRTRPNHVLARVSATRIDRVERGAPVMLSVNGDNLPGTVSSIGDFAAASGDQTAGYDVRFSFDDPAAAARFDVGERVAVTTTDEAQTTLAVPLVAIEQDGASTSVLIPQDEDSEPRRVEVAILAEADGFVAITSKELTEGDLVIVR